MSWFVCGWFTFELLSIYLYFPGRKRLMGLQVKICMYMVQRGCWKGEVDDWVHHRKDSKSRKTPQYSIKKEDILYWLLNFLSKVDIYSKNTTNS